MSFNPRVPVIAYALLIMYTLSATINQSPISPAIMASRSEVGVPDLEYHLDYEPLLNLTSPFQLMVSLTSRELNLTHFTLTIFLNYTLPGGSSPGVVFTEMEGVFGRAEFTLPPPYVSFNFTFYLVIDVNDTRIRIPSLSELPVSFEGEIVDVDGDGMDDRWEMREGLDPSDTDDYREDTDGDGLEAREEYLSLTTPSNPDTDGDGMDDGWEVNMGTCPFLKDSRGDYDGDGATNYQEYVHGTDPRDSWSRPDLAPLTPWYYVLSIVVILLILLIYFAAQTLRNRTEEEFLHSREKGRGES